MSLSVIETLASLQEIDRRKRERQLEIAEIERQTAEDATLVDEKRRLVAAGRAEFEAATERRRELEALLQGEERRIKEQRMRLSRIRNDKELIAAQREIDSKKESNSRMEEELLGLLEQHEAIEGNLKALEEELRSIEERIAGQASSFSSRIEQLRSELDQDAGGREAMAATLSSSLRKRYEHIFQRRGGIAVVEIRQGSCGGCNMNVPPQLFIEIQKQREIIGCPSCQRILVWRPEMGSGDAESTR